MKKFTILPQPFAIDTGELTPTLKIKRKVVAQKYAREIEAMYADEQLVAAVWRREHYVVGGGAARSR